MDTDTYFDMFIFYKGDFNTDIDSRSGSGSTSSHSILNSLGRFITYS